MVDLEALDIDKARIWSAIFWILGAIFSFIAAVRSYKKDLQPN